MPEEKRIAVDRDARASFHNNVDFCIGTGRMGLALAQEYQEQLRMVQEEIGFQHIRGHGLFCDDMAIYHEYEENGAKKAEFNTSYTPKSVIHDTNLNAAFIAHQLSRLGDGNASYSYWTFGDVFEEQGVPFTPFHGGFGLVADGYLGVCWNPVESGAQKTDNIVLSLAADAGTYSLLTETVDEETCNPLKVWHDLGEPATLTDAQKRLLRQAAQPFVRTCRLACADEAVEIALSLQRNAVVWFDLRKCDVQSDRGGWDRSERRRCRYDPDPH